MKLLIVDDEELTRTGLISSIDWHSLGIKEVYQADDGRNGLKAARLYKPEIILCDVRMPRMDGITMLSRLEETIPDSVYIFMSGYSDKEYLKAAIKLKAVTYIEKPLDLQEVSEAITEAKERYVEKQRSHRAEALHSMAAASRLTLKLTRPWDDNGDAFHELITTLPFPVSSADSFTSYIVKLDTGVEFAGEQINEIYENLQTFVRSFHMNCIYAEKKHQYLVYFFLGSHMPSDSVIRHIGEFLQKQYETVGKYYIAAGEPFSGISRAYNSYTSAVILLQNSFFYPEGTFLFSRKDETALPSGGRTLPVSLAETFAGLLAEKNHEQCTSFLENLCHTCMHSRGYLPNQVKDLYYKLLMTLDEARKQQQIPSKDSGEQSGIVAALENCFSYETLHRILQEKTDCFFADAKNSHQDNPTIFLIKEYISQNYANETLSVKDISSHVFLSTSYVCTFFKNETGRTLNQYLTEYRMEKAKQLLSDHRYKITDISSRVGYSDGNYFGKSFKKYTGLSPSEYRENTDA